ncbi:MAG: hypothetical protein RL756_2081 [Pseudomonadota bacterium]
MATSVQAAAAPLRKKPPGMADATSYAEWKHAAQAHDERTGAAAWRRVDESRRYDYRVIRRRLEEIRQLKAAGDPHQILYYLGEGIHGNMGGMGSPRLYQKARFGTKELVTHYIEELAGALEIAGEVDETVVSREDKLEMFRRASLCFGRTALMLSGGGALGPFHIGVLKALHEQDLLPSVLSGSSAGSLMAATVGTRSPAERDAMFDAGRLARTFREVGASNLELLRGNQRIGVDALRAFVAHQIPDLTFREAFEVSGLRINITVSPREVHQQSRLLNAVTSPNVLIREAVLASCAVPGVFPPVTLAARNRFGQRQPYVPSRQWVDGSLTDDLPAKRLSRLYGVNHFITSQTNPLAIWALRDTQSSDSLLARLWEINQNASREWLKATFPLAMEFTKNFYPLNLATRMAYSLATQDYTADINILPRRRFWDPRKLLSILSEDEVRFLIAEGEAATWPRIEMIRNCTRVSRTLDRIIDRMTPGVAAA